MQGDRGPRNRVSSVLIACAMVALVDTGSCKHHKLLGTASEYHARYEVTCAKNTVFVTVAIEHEPPHRIRGLLVKNR